MAEVKPTNCACGLIQFIPNSRLPANVLYPSEPRAERLRHLHQPLYTPKTSKNFEIDENEIRSCKYDEYPFPQRSGIPLVVPVGDITGDEIRPGDKLSMWIIKMITNQSLGKLCSVQFHNLTSSTAQYQVNAHFTHVDLQDWFIPIINGINERVELIYSILNYFPEEIDAFCERLISNWSGDQFLDEEGYRCMGYSENIQFLMIVGLLAMCKVPIERAYNKQNLYKIMQIVHWLRKVLTFFTTQHAVSKFISPTGKWKKCLEKLPRSALESINQCLKNKNGPQNELIEREVKALRKESVDWRAALLGMFWVCLKGEQVPTLIRNLHPLAVNVFGNKIDCDCQTQSKTDHEKISADFQQMLTNYN